MRRLILFPLLFAAACSGGGDQSNTAGEKPLPPFTFKQFRIGLPLREAKAKNLVKGCETIAGDITCKLTDERIGDLTIYDFQHSVLFDKQERFDWFYVETHHTKFDQLIRSLQSAFGEPCKVDGVRLQNALGATFDSKELSWCFAEGELRAVRRSPDDVRQSFLAFYRNRPAEPQKQYSPESL